MGLEARAGFKSVFFALVMAIGFMSSSAHSGTRDAIISASTPTTLYRSPEPVALSPDGRTAYVGDVTARNVTLLDMVAGTKRGEIPLRGTPQDLTISQDGRRLFVTERGAGEVAIIDTSECTVATRVSVGRWPVSLVLAEAMQRLYVGNQDRHTLSVIDLKQGTRHIAELAVVREPNALAMTPDERYVVVSNLLPHGVATDPTLAGEVSIIDATDLSTTAQVKLPAGSTLVRGVCTSPDGKWAYVVHVLGRFNLPITQLDHGWVNTSALSIIDIAHGSRLATLLLDDLHRGAANPYAIVCSQDGRRLWISHAAVHEISVVDIGLVHQLLEGDLPDELATLKTGSQPNIWARIKEDRRALAELPNELTALSIARAIRRYPSGGVGPRHLALSRDEQKLLVANYFSGTVSVLDATTGSQLQMLSLGEQSPPDATRRGEMIFHDATRAFQRWQSCSSCHPNQGRVDGLRWDFLRDGIGNGKDTPSLVLVSETEPLNRRATRQTVRIGAQTGLTAGHLMVPREDEVEDLLAYLVSLRPEANPHVGVDGDLTPEAKRGKALFFGKARCDRCHPLPYFTDQKMHNIGVISPTDPDGRYDTPTLIEAYRTAPYLHDGRALTLKSIFSRHDERGRHGNAKALNDKELDDLVAYLQTL